MSKSNKSEVCPTQRPEPIAPNVGSDRKIRAERVLVSFPVIATHQGHPIQGHLWAMNMSWSGMLLATNFPLNVRDELNLEFRLPDSEIPISVRARVVHRVHGRIPEEATSIGVAFIGVDQNVRRMLSGFVLENLSGQ